MQTNTLAPAHDYTTLSESKIWQSNHAFFANGGNQIWKEIPHHVTNSPCHASRLAHLISRYWQDIIETGAADKSERFYVLEIGSGIGKFAGLLIQELKAICQKSGLSDIKFTLVMTDITPHSINQYQCHPFLTPFAKAGFVDFALYDFLADSEIWLINQKIKLQNPINPVVSIANYIFCSLPQDYFKIEARKLYIGKAPTTIQLPENTCPNQHFTFNSIGLSLQYEAIAKPYRHDELFNVYLNELESKVDLGYFIYPKSSLFGLSNLLNNISKKMLLIASDKGFATDRGLRAMEESGLTMHGRGFSLPVDFKAIGRYAELNHGSYVHQHIEQDLSTAVYSFGHKLEHLPTYMNAAKEILDTPSSGDFVQLFHEVFGNITKFSWNAMISMLKINEWDPEIFGMLFIHFLEHLPHTPPVEINKLLRAIPLIEKKYYPYSGGADFHYLAGMIYQSSGQISTAILHFKNSLLIEHEKDYVLRALAKCYLEAIMLSEAAETAKRALSMAPNDLEMIGVLSQAEKKLC